MLRVTPRVVIEEWELEERFVRASGPGGQNVNKVATAVELRFDAARSPALDDEMRERLRRAAGARLTADGILVIDARRYRTQARNREDARERLIEMLREAAARPKSRRKTAPSRSAREHRMHSKKHRGRTKLARGRVAGEE